MDETSPKIVGSRALPCHGRRAARLAVSSTPLIRRCDICGKRFSITFAAEPRLSERIGLAVYRMDVEPWIDGRTRRRLEGEAAREAAAPRLPFGDGAGVRDGDGTS